MIGTFFFYLSRTFKNQTVSRIRRLKQPKYLLPALVGAGYLYLIFFRRMFTSRGMRPAPALPVSIDMLPLVEAGFGVLLLIVVLLPWILPWKNRGITFSEAEIQFLFPAPISRRALIHFRLVKMQLGILFSVLITFLFFGRGRFGAHPVALLLTLWAVYSFLALYRVGTSLAQTSLLEHGVWSLRRHFWLLFLLAAAVVSIVIWIRWYIPPPPEAGVASMENLQPWLLRTVESGPAFFLLLPFRMLVRPAFAPDMTAFLGDFAISLAMLALVYLWVLRSDAGFEEASLERARKLAIRLEAARSGRKAGAASSGAKVRRPLFRLAPEGPQHIAIFWKNLISFGRAGSLRILPVVVVVAVSMTIIFSRQGGERSAAPVVIGMIAAVMAGFLTLLGPMMIRDDLRIDILLVDLLKTYPVPGWKIVLGEMLAPTAVLAAAQCGLLAIAAYAAPGFGDTPWPLSHRILAALACALLFPCFSLLGISIQNAAVLLIPGWVQLGKEQRQGIEAMGQRLITMVANVFILVFAVLPAGLLFAAVYFAGNWLLGWGVIPIAAAVAALVLLAEAGIGIWWMGRLYDRFDVSLEGAGS